MIKKPKETVPQRRHIDSQQTQQEKVLKITEPGRNENKTGKRQHLTSVKMASLKCLQITNVGENVEKRE